MLSSILLVSIGLIFSPSSSADPCGEMWFDVQSSGAQLKSAQSRVLQTSIAYQSVASDQLRLGMFPASKIGEQSDVFVGIYPNGHSYLVAGRYRFDGEFYLGESKIKESRMLSEGLILRLRDRDGSLMSRIEALLESGEKPFAFNCTSGMCKLLIRGGVQRGEEMGGKLKTVFPNRFIRRAIQEGLRDKDGREIEVETFVIGDHSVESIVSQVRKRSAGVLASKALVALYFGVFGFL